MKNKDLGKLISQYLEIKQKMRKKYANTFKLSQILKEIEHRYYHETGGTLKFKLENLKEN